MIFYDIKINVFYDIKVNIMNVYYVSRKTKKVLQDNCQLRRIMACLSNGHYHSLTTYCKLHMNQQSPEHQQINRLNNACVKINLCMHIVITFILCMKCDVCVLYKEYP